VQDPEPDPLVKGTDPKTRIRILIRTQNVTDPKNWFPLIEDEETVTGSFLFIFYSDTVL
jgi:hypothetical protein